MGNALRRLGATVWVIPTHFPSFFMDRFVVPPRDDSAVSLSLDISDVQQDVIARRHDEAIQQWARSLDKPLPGIPGPNNFGDSFPS